MDTESALKNLLSSKKVIEKVYVFGWGHSNRGPIESASRESSLGISLNGALCHGMSDILLVNDTDNLRKNGESAECFEVCITPDTETVIGLMKDKSIEVALGDDDSIHLFEYLLITVAQIFRFIKKRSDNAVIQFVGVDFETNNEVSYESQRLKIHQEIFEVLKEKVFDKDEAPRKPKKKSDLKLVVTRNNDRLKKLKTISSSRVVIVAEFTSNHFGDSETLIEMIKQAKMAGADAIKLQKRDVDTFYSAEKLQEPYISKFGSSLREYRTGVELDKEQIVMALEECDRYDLPLFFSVLDRASYEYLSFLSPYLIKLPSTISNHKNYFEFIKKHHTGGIVVSTGMTDQYYEQQILELDVDHLFLLQCTSAYPTPPSEVNLNVISHYRELSDMVSIELIPGFSSHDPGSLGCQLSVGYGARMIEKHVKLKTEQWNHFDVVALSLEDQSFAKFCADIRLAEKYAGIGHKNITKSEHHKYEPTK